MWRELAAVGRLEGRGGGDKERDGRHHTTAATYASTVGKVDSELSKSARVTLARGRRHRGVGFLEEVSLGSLGR
jgi:hypothetical protein